MARSPTPLEQEVLPEPDRLEGFAHPRETERLYGHEAAERQLTASVADGHLHHAWLLTGPEGIGKASLAYRFAAHVLAKPAERDPLASSLDIAPETVARRQVRALSHPGLLVIRRPYDFKSKRVRTEITVDEVRRLRSFLSLTADEDAWRVVIIDPADDMNANAANALLKSLEEPPARMVFLLISSAPGRLLATIRSRCRTLPMGPLSGEALRKAVHQAMAASSEDIGAAAMPEAGEWAALERLSGGSVRRLLSLKAAGGLDLNTRINKLVAGLPRLDWASVHKLADELASPASEQKFELYSELLSGLLSRMVRLAASSRSGDEDAALAKRLIPEAKLASWAELWETAARDKDVVQALNLDRKSLILGTFSKLEAIARA